jgi:phage/plasmid-like protein (TIGR03299 family)
MQNTNENTLMNWADALEHYGLNYNVEKRPVRALISQDHEVLIDNLYSIIRSDTGKPLSGVAVNGRYECIQTNEFAGIGNAICGELGANFVNGGELLNGKGLFLQAKLPGIIRVKNTDDTIDKMLTFITAHDGSLPFMVSFLANRLFCSNQFKVIGDDLRNGVKIRHTRNAEVSLTQAHKTVLEANNAYRGLAIKLDWLTDQRMTNMQMQLATRRFFGVKDEQTSEDLSTHKKNAINEVLKTISEGPGQSIFQGTAYSLWNGFTHWIDHVRPVRKTTNRFEAGMVGSGAKLKDKAINIVEATLANSEPEIVSYAT